jgi:hypothetical protein
MSVKRLTLFVSVLTIIFGVIVSAAIFNDTNLSDFSSGTFYRTFYNQSGFIQLNISQGYQIGNFSSRIFDAGMNSTWNNISYFTDLCYECELPNNGQIESGNFVRPANMTNNILLLHMNEQSGNIIDSSGNSNNGSPIFFEGNEYNASGKFGASLDFEITGGVGPAEYINFSTPAQLNQLENQLTLEAWVKPESFPSDPTIIDKGTSLMSFYISSGATNALKFILDTSVGSPTTYSASTDMDVDQWYHLVATYNGSQIRLYLNGVLDNTPASRTGTVSTNNLDLIVGSGWSGSNPLGFPFDGLIDEVAIYNRSLSAQEIEEHYTRGVSRLNISVRSCDDALCLGDNYTFLNNNTSGQTMALASNRYFQYRLNLNSTDTKFTPKLYNISVQYLQTNNPPIVNLTYPRNNTNYSILQTNLNYTVIDTDLDSCWYTLNSGQTNTTLACGQNATGLVSSQGTNTWTIYANDTSGAMGQSSTSFFIDSLGPSINIIDPVNNSLLTNRTVYINYTVVDTGVGLNRCWWTNSSGAINTTIACGTNFSFVGFDGVNTVRIYANDTFGNVGSITNSYTINTLAPSVNIIRPISGSVIGNFTSIYLNFSAIDSNLQSCWYSVEEITANISLPGCQNTTFSLPGQGVFSITVYANDTTGNVGFDTNPFTVSVDAPSINPISPIDQYFSFATSQKINFVYTPIDLDLQSCSLWTNSTGIFLRNQTNSTVISGQQNSFSLNMSNSNEGNFSWAVLCNDTLGHQSMIGNQSFYIDRTRPNVTLNEPNGTYTSLSNIPISLSYIDASPVQCFYNVTFAATGNIVIGNSELASCSPTTFTLDTESSYFLWMSVNDSSGNVNITRKSFTISIPPSGGGGSSGGSSGGGGGGGGSVSVTGRATYEVGLGNIEALKIHRGESESIELPVTNKGLRFLNNCLFTASAGVSEWVSGEDVQSLSPGQSNNYVFTINVPIDAEVGDYFVTLGVDCQEVDSSFTYQIEVIGGEFELNILEAERQGTRLKVNYAIENFADQNKELDLNYKLIKNENTITEGTIDSLDLGALERIERTFEFELPKNSVGDYTLIMEASDGLDTNQKQQTVRLSSASLTGFAVSDTNLRTIAWFGIVVLLAFGAFIVIKLIRSQLALRKASGQIDRQFISIQDKY